jgi:putative transposase
MSAPRKYPNELRERAVRLVLESGRPIAHIAQDLGVHREALRQWVRQAEADQGRRTDRPTTAEHEELKRLRKENAELRRANEILKAASTFSRRSSTVPGPGMTRMIDALRGRFGVEPICRVLQVPASTYYARKRRPPSARAASDMVLLERIRRIHQVNYQAYGARRVWKQLGRDGIKVARCTVERLMRAGGLHGVRRGRKQRTTTPEPAALRPADLVGRQFVAPRPDRLWVADLTYVWTFQGWVYVAFVLDVFSRMIVGWQLANHLRTDLPLDALEMALWRRDLRHGELVHHSDAGCQPGFR